ncbi:MAG: hypothetical protein ABI954_06880 [Pyrinomonadaceae bacterium]
MAKIKEKLSTVKIKLIILILFLLFSVSCIAVPPAPTIKNQQISTLENASFDNHSPENYQSKLKTIAIERLKLADEYRKATGEIAKKNVLEKARIKFIASIDKDIFPFWYGTDWDFYGTTEKPGEGKIACGYFVTTVLRDAGISLNRVSLAQQASENIIKSLTTAPFIQRYHNAGIENFVEEVKKEGSGLYIVGLDFHVGFILQDNGKVYFIHSSYIEPSEVIREEAVKSAVLANSKYRVIGKISGDDQLIIKWLNQTSIPTLKR